MHTSFWGFINSITENLVILAKSVPPRIAVIERRGIKPVSLKAE
jgi:hypothetical protein